ncbi:hypothetical protein F2Q70_00044001 [Brassica cretica]|uniref:Uncharacterized protein n=1 Tax=Brassica cretica TaxID=69181 RepID=A0A8S9KL24_BRACR|nr:hypothetical protein F2Q70_00044001 [Brassica cretica]
MLQSQLEHDREEDKTRRNGLRQRAPPIQQQQARTPTKPPLPPPPHPSEAEHPSLVSDNPYPKTLTYTTSPRFAPPPTTSSLTAYLPPHPKPRGDAPCEGKRLSSSKESSGAESLKTSSKIASPISTL